MFGLIKQVFVWLMCFSKSLSSIANSLDNVKFVSLNNQQYMTQPYLIIIYILMNTLKDYVTIHLQLI